MPGRVASIPLRAALPAPERVLPGAAPDADDGEWVVLIGAGSDADEATDFLDDLWRDIEREPNSPPAPPRRSSPRSGDVGPAHRTVTRRGRT